MPGVALGFCGSVEGPVGNGPVGVAGMVEGGVLLAAGVTVFGGMTTTGPAGVWVGAIVTVGAGVADGFSVGVGAGGAEVLVLSPQAASRPTSISKTARAANLYRKRLRNTFLLIPPLQFSPDNRVSLLINLNE